MAVRASGIAAAATSCTRRNAGRKTPKVVAFLPGVVTDDPERAREVAAGQLAFYDKVPSYQRVVGLEGASRAADLAVIGDEKVLAAAVQRYFDAGADEVVVTQSGLDGPENQLRTWKLLGELARDHGYGSR